jgi:D-beta-D-heptose 7-phosphate kinase/D-beta-D-heptose 1-phosphate adenosyltransferase
MENLMPNAKIVLVTGGFDPLHSGHLSYFKAARALGDRLIVGVNSDAWLARKKGRSFMSWDERANLVSSIRFVDSILRFDDNDNSASDAIQAVLDGYPDCEIVFANGGDRDQNNIPEMRIQDPRLTFAFGVGGETKANSSSWILEEWKAPKTQRTWGYYRVLHEVHGAKVKELTVEPGQRLSMQRHNDRAEFWLVTQGTATVYTIDDRSTDTELNGVYRRHQCLHIPRHEWHQLVNDGDEALKLVEIQYGERCEEDDIERAGA